MKVCLVMASSGEGGLEDHVAGLANSFATELEVVVVAPASFGGKLVSGVTFAPLDLSRNRRNPLVLWQLLQIMRRHRPDIVHAHANKAAAMVAAVRRFYPARYLATVHGSKRQTGVYGKFDHVVAVSRAVAATLPDVPASVIYNGVAPLPPGGERQLRHQFGIDRGTFVCGAIGRLVPVKRFDLLIRAFAEVDGVLMIIGDGPERELLEKLAADLGIAGKVHFLGFVPNAATCLSQFNAVAISSDREGFSYVLAESLVNRIPVIATDVADIKEIIGADHVVPVGDLQGLARKLQAAAHDEHLTDAYAAAFAFAAREFTQDSMLSKLRQLYTRLFSAGRTRF
jgi:glycosyltransferase involved in cell wall biosynthesis